MAKSRGRKFAEITSPSSGVFDLTSVPTITNAKLQNSAMTLAGSSVSLGGTGVANTDALSEGSSNLYFTNARVQSFLGGGTLAGNVVVPDNRSIYLGSNSDFRLVHNTSDTQLINATGELQITSNGGVTVTGATTFSADLTVDTSTLKVDSSNNRVGIGTASPNTNLQLYHATDDISINVSHGTGGSYPKKSGISFGATSTSLGGDATFTGGAGIQVTNTAASNNPTEMGFFTTSGGAPTTRMLINSDGKVGIAEGGVIYASRFSVGKPHTHTPGSVFTSSPSSFFSEAVLGGTTGNTQKIVTFGGSDATNVSGLSIYRYRRATGTNWTTDGFSLRQEVDSTASIYDYINFAGGNVGIGGVTNPARELEVTGSGNVYIRVTAPTANDSAAIELKNTAETWTIANDDTNSDALEFRTSGGTPLTLTTSGLLGIGTTSPGFKLQLGDNVDNLGAVTTNKQIMINLDGGYSTSYSRQYKVIGFSGTTNGGTDDIKGSTYSSGEQLKNFYIGLMSDQGYFNASRFSIIQGAQERLVINQSGMVGIGDTTPQALLHVKHAGGGFDEVARLTAVANSANDGAFLGFHGNSTSKFYGFVGGYDIDTNKGGVKIGVGNGETAIADSMTKMTIDNTGNVGIGTTSPSFTAVSGSTSQKGLHIQNSGNDTSAHLKLTGHNNTGTPGQATDFEIIHKGDALQTVFRHGGAERLTFQSSGLMTVGGDAYREVETVYRRARTLNRVYTHVANINGTGLGTSYEVHVRGTTSSVVVNAHFHVMVGHYYDISIKSFGNDYTDTKIKVVSNGNEDSSVYLGCSTINNSSFTARVSIRSHDGSPVDMTPSTAYATCHLEHEQSTKGTQESSVSTASTGSGPTNAYSV